jgi:phage terminase large subunit-like protein
VQDAFDLTGLYPEWYEGFVFDHPVKLICGGLNNDKTRDLLQKALLGNPVEKDTSLGTGWIPRHCLDPGKISLKRGVTDAFHHVMVKHHRDGKFIQGLTRVRDERYLVNDGWSTASFSSYESGKEAWMGDTVDIYHGDEECKLDILSQMGRGCIATGGHIRMTFTPENGKTATLAKVKKEWSCHEATFADVAGEDCTYAFEDGDVLTLKPVYTMKGKIGHINKKTIEKLELTNPPWMMKTRMLGLPMVGEGLVFPYMESQFKIEPITLPEHWKRIDAMDFGGSSTGSHPTAFVRLAYDEDNDVIYVYDGFRAKGKEIPEIATKIRMKPHTDVIPVIWPHDGNKKLGEGAATRVQYADAGVTMFRTHFTNPPNEADGKKEGAGGISILPGITEMSSRMNLGKFKVFSTVTDFFEEYREYHMKDGNIIDEGDDFMSACRYGVMSIRHSVLITKKHKKLTTISGGSWLG